MPTERSAPSVVTREGGLVVRKLHPDSEHIHLSHALMRREAAEGRAATLRRPNLIGVAVFLLSAFCVVAIVWPIGVMAVMTTACTLLYLVTILNRMSLVRRALDHDPSMRVSDHHARAVPETELPTYTVLVPAYGEPSVVADLVAALERIEYPRESLDIKLLLESDDLPTIEAADSVTTDLPVEVVLVPPGEPRTKPRALNYGMEFARGDLVTIYDAEDHPDPLQLRRAVVALDRAGPDVVCLQARLSFYGGSRNLLTRWFTTDYFTWFRLYLPGLAATGTPIPLGGTSNHFRREALEEAGCWDPWNVTEDAELGIRLQRKGARVAVLDSVTMEEPNVDVVNWVKQRSRWYKGYLQTFAVAFRRPGELVSDLGWRNAARLGLFVGGTPVLALLSAFFWTLTLTWLVTRSELVGSLFPGWTNYMAVTAWMVGNVVVMYISVLTLRVVGRAEYLSAALLVPVYWLLMSIAAIRALVQLVTKPFHWEKTVHGLAVERSLESSELGGVAK